MCQVGQAGGPFVKALIVLPPRPGPTLMPHPVAFVTIGQSPRADVLPEILAEVRTPIAPTERGVLDDLTLPDIRALEPGPADECLVSRLRDGTEVLLAKSAIESRLCDEFATLDKQGFDLIVLLCTGHFGTFHLKTPFLEPQHAVDHFVQGLTYGVRKLGVLLPAAQQIDEFHGIPGAETAFAFASPYTGNSEAELAVAAETLSGTEAIVMHCMGFTEKMRRQVMTTARRPVHLSRRIVAHAIDLILS
jgi:protein AroM